MYLQASLGERYKSSCQQARVITENWGHENLFCPRCESNSLNRAPTNSQVVDFVCPQCKAPFQLKSKSGAIGDSIPDAGFYAMMKAIREDRTPNLFVLQYDRNTWRVRNVLLVPQFAFSPSAILKRKPLAVTARRAGWIGCNIVLKNIPDRARISIVVDEIPRSRTEVRQRFREVEPLKDISISQRGWTLDVWRMVQSLGTNEFATRDAYVFEPELKRFYPGNQHAREKIRQQLQLLRDKGLLTQIGRGKWQQIQIPPKTA